MPSMPRTCLVVPASDQRKVGKARSILARAERNEK